MPHLFIITGPSGAGKSSVADALLARLPNLKKITTCTTRPPRAGEKDGVDYHFLDKETFQAGIQHGDFLEWAKVYDHFYGSRKQDVQRLLQEGLDLLAVLDVQGARSFQEKRPDALVLYITAESPEYLQQRIARRADGTMNLEERLTALNAELAFAKEADYLIVNKENQLGQTIDEAEKIILRIK
jgi:guanylate kinase